MSRLWGMAAALCLALGAAGPVAADKGKREKGGKCHLSDVKRARAHVHKHLKFPSAGKEIKQACKKEWPDEFSKEEWACFDGAIQDDHEYKDPKEVLAALGLH